MQWITHGERVVYGDNRWVDVCLVEVEQPDGTRWEHHVLRLRHLAVVAAVNSAREVLLLWRHRFITDTWAWELPMGLIEAGETPEQAAAREFEEETGWRAGTLRPLVYSQPANGITDSEHFVFRTDDAVLVGPPTEMNESDRAEWVPLGKVLGMVDRREIVSAGSLVGLMRVLLDEQRIG